MVSYHASNASLARIKSFHERNLIEFLIYCERRVLAEKAGTETVSMPLKTKMGTNKNILSTLGFFSFTKFLCKEHSVKSITSTEEKVCRGKVEKLVNQFCCSFKLAPINQVQS